MPWGLEEPGLSFLAVLQCLQELAVEAIGPRDDVRLGHRPFRKARGLVMHRPVGAAEVEGQEVDALTGEFAAHLVERRELGLHLHPQLLLRLREPPPTLGVLEVAVR